MNGWSEAYPRGWWRRQLENGDVLHVHRETDLVGWQWRHARWSRDRRDYVALAMGGGLASAEEAREAADAYMEGAA